MGMYSRHLQDTSESVYRKECNNLINKHAKTFVNVSSLGYVLNYFSIDA